MLTHGALVRVAFTMIRLIDETEGMMEASQRGLARGSRTTPCSSLIFYAAAMSALHERKNP